MLSDLNHLTLAVSDLARSVDFYATLLGCRERARWERGAYLELGRLWLCLSLDAAAGAAPNYTHYAFSIGQADLDAFAGKLRQACVPLWKENRSEGGSIYFLDPDGHRLEAHVGDLASRLAACRRAPYPGMQFFDPS